MLTSAVSTVVSSASATSSASAVSMTTGIGLPEFGVLGVIALILLLSAKEILSATDKWNKSLDCYLNMANFSLMISFCAIVVFKVSEIL